MEKNHTKSDRYGHPLFRGRFGERYAGIQGMSVRNWSQMLSIPLRPSLICARSTEQTALSS